MAEKKVLVDSVPDSPKDNRFFGAFLFIRRRTGAILNKPWGDDDPTLVGIYTTQDEAFKAGVDRGRYIVKCATFLEKNRPCRVGCCVRPVIVGQQMEHIEWNNCAWYSEF